MNLIAGTWDALVAPVKPLTDVHLATIQFKEGGKTNFTIPPDQTVFLYVVKGTIRVNGEDVTQHYTVEFSHEGKVIEFKALTDAFIIFGFATPYHEAIAAQGPFVMNTYDEIQEAYRDYHAGKFGGV